MALASSRKGIDPEPLPQSAGLRSQRRVTVSDLVEIISTKTSMFMAKLNDGYSTLEPLLAELPTRRRNEIVELIEVVAKIESIKAQLLEAKRQGKTKTRLKQASSHRNGSIVS